jgi:dUTP pyrophosphatase
VASPRVQVRKLRSDAKLPCYMSAAAAGADLSAAIDSPLVLGPGQRAAVGTGLALAIAPGYEAQVRPRSGAALKLGLTVVNAPGTIDSDYRGELKVLLINLSRDELVIEAGQRIAQMVVAPVVQAEFDLVDELSSTERGAGGFGSTGAS